METTIWGLGLRRVFGRTLKNSGLGGSGRLGEALGARGRSRNHGNEIKLLLEV